VELKTIQDLGGPDKFKDWKITGEREMFAPHSLEFKKERQELERDRLRKLGLDPGDESLSQMPYLMVSKQQAAAAGAGAA
jgi:hypothetical protein